jgi:hypothetical protein
LESEDEEFDDWEDDYDYPEEEPLRGAGYSLRRPRESQQDVHENIPSPGSCPGWRVSTALREDPL